jgi:hypothetical protein
MYDAGAFGKKIVSRKYQRDISNDLKDWFTQSSPLGQVTSYLLPFRCKETFSLWSLVFGVFFLID